MIGGESTGKTTLALALAATSHGVVVSEALRAFVDDHGRTPLPEEQHSILLAQRSREIAASQDHPNATIVCDPATTMTAIYSELYLISQWLDDLRVATPVLEITGTQGRILMARELLDAQFGSVWQQPAPRSST